MLHAYFAMCRNDIQDIKCNSQICRCSSKWIKINCTISRIKKILILFRLLVSRKLINISNRIWLYKNSV